MQNDKSLRSVDGLGTRVPCGRHRAQLNVFSHIVAMEKSAHLAESSCYTSRSDFI